MGKGTVFVPTDGPPLTRPTLKGSNRSAPSGPTHFWMHRHRGFHPRLLMYVPFGEQGTVKPLRVGVVESYMQAGFGLGRAARGRPYPSVPSGTPSFDKRYRNALRESPGRRAAWLSLPLTR